MNRRSFLKSFTAGAAVLSIPASRAFAAQPTRTNTRFVSDLTGTEIVLLDEGYAFNPDTYDRSQSAGVDMEVISFSNETSTVMVYLLEGVTNPDLWLEDMHAGAANTWDVWKVVDSGVTPDGQWFAVSGAFQDRKASCYGEYQVGAFGAVDMVVTMTARPEAFGESLDALQSGVTIGEMATMIFLDQSEIASFDFPTVGTVQTTTRQTSTRGSNGRRTGQQSTTPTPVAETDDGYASAVNDHRTAFLSTFRDFADALSVFGDDASTEAEQQDAFATLDSLAIEWQGYPDDAQALTAPPELASLEVVYLDWADAIASLGATWSGIRSGSSEIAVLFDEIDNVAAADAALASELDAVLSRRHQRLVWTREHWNR